MLWNPDEDDNCEKLTKLYDIYFATASQTTDNDNYVN